MFTPFYAREPKVGIESRLANEATFTTEKAEIHKYSRFAFLRPLGGPRNA